MRIRCGTWAYAYTELALFAIAAVLGSWATGQVNPNLGLHLLVMQLKFKPLHVLVGLGLVPLTLMIDIPIILLLAVVLPSVPGKNPISIRRVWTIVPAAVCTGFAEELLFRGTLQTAFGLWITAIAFGLRHGLRRTIRLSAVGLWYGYCMMQLNNLWPLIVAHAGCNTFFYWFQFKNAKAEQSKMERERTIEMDPAEFERFCSDYSIDSCAPDVDEKVGIAIAAIGIEKFMDEYGAKNYLGET